MAITVVVGGQYGSEGKGKLISYLACSGRRPIGVVRCGGSNAGHTATGLGKRYVLRQLPSGVVAEDVDLYLAAGMVIDLPVLLAEISSCNVRPRRLTIDRNAIVMGGSEPAQEGNLDLQQRIGSTLSGTGMATARKVMRDPDLLTANDVSELASYIGNVSQELNRLIDAGGHVIVEGTQGFGLSLHHSPYYPFATSRDTTAGAFLSEAGLSPLLVRDIVVVLRTYPIRVAGNSGPLPGELRWDEIARRAGYPYPIAEYTTVTKRLRRVGEFDWDLAHQAIRINRPSALALHGLDYLDYRDYGKKAWDELTSTSRAFIEELEQRLEVPVAYAFTGPGGDHIVECRAASTLSALRDAAAV